MKIVPVITEIEPITLPLNKSQRSTLPDLSYTYFTVTLANCSTQCNLYLSLSSISNPDANLYLLVNPGEFNYTFLS